MQELKISLETTAQMVSSVQTTVAVLTVSFYKKTLNRMNKFIISSKVLVTPQINIFTNKNFKNNVIIAYTILKRSLQKNILTSK